MMDKICQFINNDFADPGEALRGLFTVAGGSIDLPAAAPGQYVRVIGSRFNDKAPPNADSIDITRTDYKDGSFVQYDRKKHEMRIKCVVKIFIDGKEIHLNEES